jgi:hypothetical protein
MTRRRLAIGTIGVVVVFAVVLGGCSIVLALLFRDPDPPSRDRLEPLPPGVTIVSDSAGCDHNASLSDLVCSRTIVVTKPGVASGPLSEELARWYAREKGPSMSVAANPAIDPPNPWFHIEPLDGQRVKVEVDDDHPGGN